MYLILNHLELSICVRNSIIISLLPYLVLCIIVIAYYRLSVILTLTVYVQCTYTVYQMSHVL